MDKNDFSSGFLDSLSEEMIISYLFSTDLSVGVKTLICDEINKWALDSERLLKLKNAFIRRGVFDEDLLDTDFCPIELKKIIIDDIYGSNLTQMICDLDVSLERKKLVIDLRLSTQEALKLLGQDIPIDLKFYLIDTRILSSSDIIDSLKSNDISDIIKEKIILRKVDMDNLFEVTGNKELPSSEVSLVCGLKRRDIEDYISNLDSNNILDVITKSNIIFPLAEDIKKFRPDVILEAIIAADKKTLFRVMNRPTSSSLTGMIVKKRKDTLFEMIAEIDSQNILIWLNLSDLPNDIKDYIIRNKADVLDTAIKKHNIFYGSKRYLSNSSHLPYAVKQKIFLEYKEDFIREIKELTGDEVVNKIMYDNSGELLLELLIEVGINENNVFTLLAEHNLNSIIINKVFNIKPLIFNDYINSLDLVDILSLDKLNFSGEIKNRILDSTSLIVASKLDGISNDVLLGYLKDPNVLLSVKRRIMEHFGIYEVDLQNCLETLNLDNADLLVNNYNDIKRLINLAGIEFQSFLQYGTGSQRYSNWLVDLTNIISEDKVLEFIKVKRYFFSNYYGNSSTENGVSTISNFLEILSNFNKYHDLCLNLANNNTLLSREDKQNIQFLFNTKGFNDVFVPNKLADISLYKKEFYKGITEKITGGLDLEQLKAIFNEMVFCNANRILSSIGGTEALKTLKKDNANSCGITALIDELLLYSNIIEMVNCTNNVLGLTEVLDFVFSDVEVLSLFQNLFSQFEKEVIRLYEVDSINHLTSLAKVRNIPGVINHELSRKYGGEVFDFSDKNYVLYGHVFSINESFDDRVRGKTSGKSNFISVTPISYKGQKYYWDSSEVILLFDKIPKGSFVCSSIYNMGTNHKLNNNSCEVAEFERTQRGILETSAVVLNNSEALLFAEGLIPCGLALPGGRCPSEMELLYHEKYNLPFIITQNIGTAIDNPKMVFSNNDTVVLEDLEKCRKLEAIIGVLEPCLALEKENAMYTGREVALFTDSHSLYEPTLAVLEDIRKNGITEIYSLGDNIGNGPNPVEVFDLLEEYGVISVAGNSEYYNTLGIEPFPYISSESERVDSYKWTKLLLGKERVEKLKKLPPSIDLKIGNKTIGLVHFCNDVRYDFDDAHNTYNYRLKYGTDKASEQFLYTNSLQDKKKREEIATTSKDLKDKGVISAYERPLFDGKMVTDYDAIIQGHVHFHMEDKIGDVKVMTLRAVGMGYEDDYNDTACYYVLKERKDGNFDIERRLVRFNRNNLDADIVASNLPDKARILRYVSDGKDRNGF